MYKKIFTLTLFALLLAVGCKKNEKFIDKATGQPLTVKIWRFDKALFEKQHSDMALYLDSLKKDYGYLLSSDLTKEEQGQYLTEFVNDKVLQKAWEIVNKKYANLDWLERKLNFGFAELQKDYPETALPKIYTMIAGPVDYQNGYVRRVFADDSCVVIALDWFSMKELSGLEFYNQVPKYLNKVLDSAFLAADVMKTYLREVTTLNVPLAQQNPDADLLSLMIELGKYDYATKILLDCSEQEVLRYSNEELAWCEKNESTIWGYIIQQKLLYSKDRMQFRGMLYDAPSSKGMDGSPARIAEYIGYRIVSEYVKKNDISIPDLFTTTNPNDISKEAADILNKSGFKPKKR
ncbi:MAG: hypothetical protein LBR17_01730 [Bacteroidales bacterium]|jgi:hypothetical protein|nr:hypothetical protein [Bacteroidales bacterium]